MNPTGIEISSPNLQTTSISLHTDGSGFRLNAWSEGLCLVYDITMRKGVVSSRLTQTFDRKTQAITPVDGVESVLADLNGVAK